MTEAPSTGRGHARICPVCTRSGSVDTVAGGWLEGELSVVNDPFIRWYDGALDQSVCRHIIERFEADPARGAGMVSGNQGAELDTAAKQTTRAHPGSGKVERSDPGSARKPGQIPSGLHA